MSGKEKEKETGRQQYKKESVLFVEVLGILLVIVKIRRIEKKKLEDQNTNL